MTRPTPRFHIVHQAPSQRSPWLWVVIAIVWLASLGGTWWVASHGAAPRLAEADAKLRAADAQVKTLQQQVADLRQKQTNLAMSDQISRAANSEVQSSLAERDEQIASLRADVAFYERLVGATAQRKGLNVHTIEFSPEAGGTWRYAAVLTQNLNRGAISKGEMKFAVEGVRDGKLMTVDWDHLHQKQSIPGQDYSFRYFQQLNGSVILPKDFTPQRVKISLSGGGAPAAQTFEWKVAGNGAGE